MFPNYKGKLLALIWMSVGSAVLASIFSVILISYVVRINNKVSRLSKS